MKRLAACGAMLLAGCAGGLGLGLPQWLAGGTDVEVREVGRSLYCNTAGDDARVLLLADAQAVLDWQAARGITLAGAESLRQVPHAVVEMGLRPTGGYGLAVARAAVLRGERVTLSATFVSPAPGSIRTQALSSPCVLVELPRGRYDTVEVVDQTGATRASGGLAPPAPAPVAPQTSPVPADGGSPDAAQPPPPEPAPEVPPGPAPPATPEPPAGAATQ